MAVSRFETCEELLDSAAREWGAGGKQPQGARAVAITVECSNASERCGFRVGPNVLCIPRRYTPVAICNSCRQSTNLFIYLFIFMEKKIGIFLIAEFLSLSSAMLWNSTSCEVNASPRHLLRRSVLVVGSQ